MSGEGGISSWTAENWSVCERLEINKPAKIKGLGHERAICQAVAAQKWAPLTRDHGSGARNARLRPLRGLSRLGPGVPRCVAKGYRLRVTWAVGNPLASCMDSPFRCTLGPRPPLPSILKLTVPTLTIEKAFGCN